jgi:hypothetical protein
MALLLTVMMPAAAAAAASTAAAAVMAVVVVVVVVVARLKQPVAPGHTDGALVLLVCRHVRCRPGRRRRHAAQTCLMPLLWGLLLLQVLLLWLLLLLTVMVLYLML